MYTPCPEWVREVDLKQACLRAAEPWSQGEAQPGDGGQRGTRSQGAAIHQQWSRNTPLSPTLLKKFGHLTRGHIAGQANPALKPGAFSSTPGGDRWGSGEG